MILVTGFEPYTTSEGLHVTVNPTSRIATNTASNSDSFVSAILPVSFKHAKNELVQLFETIKPKVWLGLGYAPHRATLDFEVVAINVEHSLQGDNSSDRPCNRRIVEDAPLAYQSAIDINDALAPFSQLQVETRASFHAGTFVCNQSFFLGCHFLQTTSYLQSVAFMHIPPLDNYAPIEHALRDLATYLIVQTPGLKSL